MNMADVLFDVGKYDLKPDAQIKLARLAGIIQNYPRLHLAIEGHTDNTGSDESNVKLSQQRADAVRDFLIAQGLSAEAVSSIGMGKADPVADNSTSEGRQKNRRLEIIVSAEVIGAKVGSKKMAAATLQHFPYDGIVFPAFIHFWGFSSRSL